jgi:hypothetical protein
MLIKTVVGSIPKTTPKESPNKHLLRSKMTDEQKSDRAQLRSLEKVNPEKGLPHFTAQGGGQLPKAECQKSGGQGPRIIVQATARTIKLDQLRTTRIKTGEVQATAVLAINLMLTVLVFVQSNRIHVEL